MNIVFLPLYCALILLCAYHNGKTAKQSFRQLEQEIFTPQKRIGLGSKHFRIFPGDYREIEKQEYPMTTSSIWEGI